MNISKTDYNKVLAYLDAAASLYTTMPKPKHQWRAIQIRKLVRKLQTKANESDK